MRLFNSDALFWTGFTTREGLASANASGRSRPPSRCAATFRRTDREHARRSRAGLQSTCISVVGRDKTIEPYMKADATNPVFISFTMMPSTSPTADQEALRIEAARVHPRRVPRENANDARAGEDGRTGRPTTHDREVHDAQTDREGDPRHRFEGGRSASKPRWPRRSSDQASRSRCRSFTSLPAVLCEDPEGTAGVLGVTSRRKPT